MANRQVFDLHLFEIDTRAAARRFLLSLKASNAYSPRYLDILEESLALLADYAEEQNWPTVDRITAYHLEEYLVYLQTRPRWFGRRGDGSPPSQSYIETQYRRLSRFYGWMEERGHIERNPFRLIKHPHVNERTIPTVSIADMRTLLDLVNPRLGRTEKEKFVMLRNRAALFVLFDSPSRRDEIAQLQMGSVDWDNGAIHVLGKGRKERWMTLDFNVMDVLWEYRDARGPRAVNTDALWISHRGKAMLPNWIYTVLKRLGERAGIQNLHTHRFRHTYAINALSAGMQERYLAFEGGWRKIPDTYFRTLGPEHIAERHRELSPVARLVNEDARGNGGAGKARRRRRL